MISYYGKVYTIEEAINIAIDNNEKYFVWYHNSYELDDFASKLFFIDIYYNDTGLLKKKNWTKHENVSTCISKNYVEFILDGESFIDDNDEDENINKLQEIFQGSTESTEITSKILNEFLEKNITETKNINNTVIKNLDNKITTYGQAIAMNNYETNINNKILFGLSIILFLIIILFFIMFIYYQIKK